MQPGLTRFFFCRVVQSCISEAQKYQGALYREKKGKGQPHGKPETPTASDQALVPRSAYVEDAPEDGNNVLAIVDAPPAAPTPPPAVNVFDFLIDHQTPNHASMHLPEPDEPHMIEDGRGEWRNEDPSAEVVRADHYRLDDYDSQRQFADDGYSYGAAPMPPTLGHYDSHLHDGDFRDPPPHPRADDPAFYTPAPRAHRREERPEQRDSTATKKSDKKRKRVHINELDMEAVRAQAERDAVMTDAPPVLHSGLTGGLNRLLARPEFPLSPDYSGGDYGEDSPLSPMKRSKRDAVLVAEKDRGRKQERKAGAAKKASVKVVSAPQEESIDDSGALVTTTHKSYRVREVAPRDVRREQSRREDRHRERERDVEKHTNNPRRRRRSRRSSSDSPERDRAALATKRRTLKAIEYRRPSTHSVEATDENALVVVHNPPNQGEPPVSPPSSSSTKKRAELFLSFVNKGPESERGCSVNKALKRFHRERVHMWGDVDGGKADEEKELWKSLRLRRNERGEVVVFFAAGQDSQ